MCSHDGLNYVTMRDGARVGFLVDNGFISHCHPEGAPLLGQTWAHLYQKCLQKGYKLERWMGTHTLIYEAPD